MSNYLGNSSNNVLLQTSEAAILNLNQNNKTCFILFDSGAKRTYMTKEVKWELNFVSFKQEKISIKVFGKVEGSKCRRCKNHCGRSKKKCLC